MIPNNTMQRKIFSLLFFISFVLNSCYSQKGILSKESQILSIKVLPDSVEINFKLPKSPKAESIRYNVIHESNRELILIGKKNFLMDGRIEIDSAIIKYLVKNFEIPNANLSINHTVFISIFRNESGKVIKFGFMAATDDSEYNAAILIAIKNYIDTNGWIRKNKEKKCSIIFYGIDFDEIRFLQG